MWDDPGQIAALIGGFAAGAAPVRPGALVA
jgi:hypothetical protein